MVELLQDVQLCIFHWFPEYADQHEIALWKPAWGVGYPVTDVQKVTFGLNELPILTLT